MGTEGSGASRGGGEGIHNEDAFRVEEGLGLYVVCDGASGTPAGEIAAGLASQAVEAIVEGAHEDLQFGSGDDAREVVERAMHYAMASVAEAEQIDPELRGLTTTMTILLAHRTLGVIGHRGDSRAYLIRRGHAHQLTVDHELTRAASSRSGEDSDSDVFGMELRPGDTIVLCTDGAEEVVLDPSIVRVAGDLAPRLLASRIVSLAHSRRPEQDATAVVVRVQGDREPSWLEFSALPHGTTRGRALQMS